MKQLYNLEVDALNVEIYEVLKARGMRIESFKDSTRGSEFKVISVIADSEDMLALRLCADVKIVDDPEAAGGLQTTVKPWSERLKDRLSKIVS